MSARPGSEPDPASVLHYRYLDAQARLHDLAASLAAARQRLESHPDLGRAAAGRTTFDELSSRLQRLDEGLAAAHQALLQTRPMALAAPGPTGPESQTGTDALLIRPGVMCLNPGGGKTPLFLVPAGSDGLAFFHLSRCWDLARPLHVLLPPGLARGEAVVEDPAELVAYHLAAVRSIQPRGPYLLGGYCVGGLFALEMARQLTAGGEQVQFLALIDSFLPFSRWRLRADRGRYLVSRIPHHLRALAGLRGRQWSPYLAHLGRILPGYLRHLSRVGPLRGPAQASPAELAKAAKHRAFLRLRPRPWPGRALLFVAADPWRVGNLTPSTDWERVVLGGVTRVPIPGNHGDCLAASSVTQWAGRLLTALDQAEPDRLGCRSAAPGVEPVQEQPSQPSQQ